VAPGVRDVDVPSRIDREVLGRDEMATPTAKAAELPQEGPGPENTWTRWFPLSDT